MQKLQAVYEDGVRGQDEELRFEDPANFESLANHKVKRETLRAELSKIPGSLDADFRDERNER